MLTISGYTSCNNQPAYSSAASVTFADEAETEPVSVEEAKAYLKIDAGESTWDSLVAIAISAARQELEEWLNRSLITRTVTAVMNVANGKVSLPYGPVTTLSGITDTDSNTLTDYTLNGDSVVLDGYDKATFTYSAGYPTLPAVFKQGLLRLVAFNWQHSGDDGTARNIGDITGLRKYRRVV